MAPLTALQLTVALFDVTVDDKPVGALQAAGAVVVNCAVEGVVVPDGHVAVTLQSYNDDAVNPVRFADVPV